MHDSNEQQGLHNLGVFRDTAELNLKVSLRMGSESVIGVSNSCIAVDFRGIAVDLRGIAGIL